MRMIISLALMIFFGAFTGYVAKRRGRDPVGWFLIGLLFGIFGLLLLLLLPAIGTKEDESVEENEDQKLARLSPMPPRTDYVNKEWFFIDYDRRPQGPMPFSSLKMLWKQGKITDSSFVWCEEMKDWEKIRQIDGFIETINDE